MIVPTIKVPRRIGLGLSALVKFASKARVACKQINHEALFEKGTIAGLAPAREHNLDLIRRSSKG